MTQELIDLTKIDFWLACLVGALVLAPMTDAYARKIAWAIINLSFLTLILHWQSVGVMASIAVVYLLLRSVAGPSRLVFGIICGFSIAGVFILHKLPVIAEPIGVEPLTGILSTIGFSYVALRMVELLRAVFEKRYPAPDFPSIVNYLVPFHMLAAGPILAYDDFVAQPAVPLPMSRSDVLRAMERIATGLFKKFVLAYVVQKLFLTDFEAGGAFFFVEVQFFFLWLYLDFSAYSDIAVGIGRLLGVATPENFNKPYLARNAIDFWDRWHISLSMFIRRNVFIPIQLQLTRRAEGRHPLLSASVAFTISFMLVGLWHGLTLNFLLWGTIHALGLIVANLWRHYLKQRLGARGVKEYLADWRVKMVARVVTYEFVAFSLVVLFYP